MSVLHPVRCAACETRGTTFGVVCDACLGKGWRWSDGKRATLCPELSAEGRRLPCGRSGGACSSCLRPDSEIGDAADVRRTREASAAWYALSAQEREDVVRRERAQRLAVADLTGHG